MRYHTIELNERELNFRLTSEDAAKIEDRYNVKLLNYIQDYSIKTILNLLRYMRRGEDKNFSEKDAYALFDELADADWAIEDIMKKIIFPCCQVSGLLTKSDLEEITKQMENPHQATQTNNNQ